MPESQQMPDGRRDVLEGLKVACIQLSRCQTVCQMVERFPDVLELLPMIYPDELPLIAGGQIFLPDGVKFFDRWSNFFTTPPNATKRPKMTI